MASCGKVNASKYGEMWKLIAAMWVEMLCFSARRCRGYLHAKSLGSGMEYLSFVWLMLAHAGMETFPERLHRRQKIHLPEKKPLNLQEEDVAAPSGTSQGSESCKKKETHQGEGDNAPEITEIVVSP